MIESPITMIHKASAEGYAVGYFESWNIESLQGAIDAAEQTRSPMVIGFSGDFLFREGRVAEEEITWYGALVKAAAESARVPCCTILNECPHDGPTKAALACGFNLVMPIAGADGRDRYLERVQAIVGVAHRQGAGVEIELDELPSGLPDADEHESVASTSPEALAEFVKLSGADLLAVSVGNVHMSTGKAYGLDFDRLRAVRELAGVPFVLHGGTGISAEDLQKAIKLGVAKVNFGTYVKKRCLDAFSKGMRNIDGANPHHLLGYGGDDDLLVITRRAVRDAVLERIDTLGCCGKA
jgi:ketose-bisphosphate aldolase